MTPDEISIRLERILPKVQKPGRYVGGELNQIKKSWELTSIRVALAFPDIYDIGVPNLGLAILYEDLNKRSDVLAERTFLPWIDMEAWLRKERIPLYSLESKHPIAEFDILGITIPYETLYTNVLNLLDLANIPIHSTNRSADHPLILAGGHTCFNPEPMADFIDAFVIGEGEEVIHEIVDCYKSWKNFHKSRNDLLLSLSQIDGVYVPSLYQPVYHHDGTISSISTTNSDVPRTILKRILPALPPPPSQFIVPSIDVVHNRVSIEIMRGCTRGCRFCHAGMINRPVRERKVEDILSAIQNSLEATGYEEIALLSLSSSDYTKIEDLISQIGERANKNHLVISLPSLRIDSFSIILMQKLAGNRQGGFTLAPEAATERMRNIINKPITSQQLIDVSKEVYSRGWTSLKLYFMIGHPSETLEDVQAIADLCKQVLSEGRKLIGKRATLHAGVSTFVPKPHTPFQWTSCDHPEQIRKKQALLKQELRGPGLKLTWTDPEETVLEALLSRGDRRLGSVIFQAWKLGAKFDAWQDVSNREFWQKALIISEIDPDFYTHRQRLYVEIFPWDHINTGVRKSYLLSEYRASLNGEIREDCREGCYACGILPVFTDLRQKNPGDLWLCPEIISAKPLEPK